MIKRSFFSRTELNVPNIDHFCATFIFSLNISLRVEAPFLTARETTRGRKRSHRSLLGFGILAP